MASMLLVAFALEGQGHSMILYIGQKTRVHSLFIPGRSILLQMLPFLTRLDSYFYNEVLLYMKDTVLHGIGLP